MYLNQAIIDAILHDVRKHIPKLPFERGLHTETHTEYILNLGADDKIHIPKDIYTAYLNNPAPTVDLNRVLQTYQPGKFEAFNL